ncbi:hypothetical protein FRC0360_00689 [Corynebacterium diphtheriae]|nr:hypothetical protein FRC0360_00689 [Corynebacterium diphtheriae]
MSTVIEKDLADAREKLATATKNWEQAKAAVRRHRAEKLEAENEVARLESLKREQDAREEKLQATLQKLEELLPPSEFEEFKETYGVSAVADTPGVGPVVDSTGATVRGDAEQGSDGEDDTTVSFETERPIHDEQRSSWQ